MGLVCMRRSRRISHKESYLRFLGAINSLGLGKVPKGHSSGILMGVKEDTDEVEDSKVGEYFVSMELRNRLTNLRWQLITMYGYAQHTLAPDFNAELSRKYMYSTLPVVMGGDFNLIREAGDKNNANLNLGLIERFNMFIDLHQL
jgi:hypothetical protein